MKIARLTRRLLGFANLAVLLLATIAIANVIEATFGVPFLPAFYAAIPVMFVGTLLLVALHEFGHAAIAALLGWRVSMVAVGPIAIKLHPPRLTFGTPPMGTNLSGGTWTVPSTRGNWHLGWITMTSGGALANITFAIVALTYAGLRVSPGVAGDAIGSLGVVSLVVGLTALVPYNTQYGGRSDGGIIYDLLRGLDPEPRVIILRVSDELISGVRPREWHAASIQKLEEYAERPLAGYELVMLYSHYLDRGDMTRARLALSRAIERFGPVDDLRIKDAFLSAFVEGDASGARTNLSHVKSKRARRSTSYFSTEAVLLLDDGDAEGANRLIWLARRALEKWPLATGGDWEMIESIERKISGRAPKFVQTEGV